MKTTRILLMSAIVLLGEVECFSQSIVWNGNGDGTSWSNPQNWVGQQVPGPTNNAFITNGAGSNVVISSTVTVESILCNKALTVSGNSLTVTAGASMLQGTLTAINGATLSAIGSNTTLTSSGAVDIDNANLYVSGGASLSLPGVSSYNQNNGYYGTVFQASGPGSVLTLAGLTNVTGMTGSYFYAYPLQIEALAGGQVNLNALVSFASGENEVLAQGTNSVVNLPALTSFYGYDGYYASSSLQVIGGGTILAGELGLATEVTISLGGGTLNLNTVTNLSYSTLTLTNGSVTLSNVVDMDNASLYVSGGASLSLPAAGSYAENNGSFGTVFEASGPGSILTLAGLTNVTGLTGSTFYAYPLQIEALAGGQVNLNALVSLASGETQVLAQGTNSLVNLPSLTSFYGYDGYYGVSSLQVIGGGTILAGRLGVATSVTLPLGGGTLNLNAVTNLSGSILTLTNGSVTLSNAADIDNASLYVSGGASLSLPAVRSYAENNGSYGTVFEASGSGSVLALAGLTNVTGLTGSTFYAYPLQIEALAGGQVNLNTLASFASGEDEVLASGTNSVVNLPALTSFYGFDGYYGLSSMQAIGTGTILAGQLGIATGVTFFLGGGALNFNTVTNLSGSTLMLTNGSVTLNNAADIDNASLYVSGGASLSLPAVRSYNQNNGSYSTVFEANGPGSVLTLAGLTNVTGLDYTFSAYPLQIEALAGGQVNLNALVSFGSGETEVLAQGTNSVVNLPALTSFDGYDGYYGLSSLQVIGGGTILAGQLGIATEVTFFLGGGTFNLNAVTNLSGSTLMLTNGSVTLSNVVDIDNTSLYVSGGAMLSLPAVGSYNQNNGSYSTVFEASGPGSVLTLAGLTNVTGLTGNTFGAYPLQIEALTGGQVNLNALASFASGENEVLASGTNSLVNLPALTSFYGYDGYYGSSSLQPIGTGTILAGQLGVATGVTFFLGGGTLSPNAVTNFSGSTLTMTNGSVTLSNKDIDGANLNVSGGAVLALTGAVSFQAGCANILWQASGAGSVLELPALTNLQGAICGDTLNIEALSGGQVLLGNLQTIVNDSVAFLSDNTGSLINLSSLSAFVLQNGQGSLTAENGGTILFNNQAFLLANVAINIPPGNPILPATLVASDTLALYGTPWHSYQVEEWNNLTPGSPVTVLLVPLTNSFEAIAAAPPPNTTFLVTDFMANPPILQLGLTPDNQVQLVLFGLTNATYQIQSTTNLRAPITWTPGSVAVMTNAFRIFPETPPIGAQFYRAKQE